MSLNKRAIASRSDYINKGTDILYVRDGVSPMTKYIEYNGQNWEYADDYATPTDLYHIYTRITANKASGKKLIGLALVPKGGMTNIFGLAKDARDYFAHGRKKKCRGGIGAPIGFQMQGGPVQNEWLNHKKQQIVDWIEAHYQHQIPVVQKNELYSIILNSLNSPQATAYIQASNILSDFTKSVYGEAEAMTDD